MTFTDPPEIVVQFKKLHELVKGPNGKNYKRKKTTNKTNSKQTNNSDKRRQTGNSARIFHQTEIKTALH